MPGTIAYIIPTEDMTLTEQANLRKKAVMAGVKLAISKSIANQSDALRLDNPESVDVREFRPIADAGAALDQWNTAALAVVGTDYSVFQAIAAPALAANRVAVFYKVSIETTPCPVSLLLIRSGGAVGNVKAWFDLEQLVNGTRVDGYFSTPMVVSPTDPFAIQVRCRIATGVLARVQLGAWIIEPRGSQITG